MNVWSLHGNVASNEQAHPELSCETLNFVVASNGGDESSHVLVFASNLVSQGAPLPEFDMIDHNSMSTLMWTENLASSEQAHQGLSVDMLFVENEETHLELWPKC